SHRAPPQGPVHTLRVHPRPRRHNPTPRPRSHPPHPAELPPLSLHDALPISTPLAYNDGSWHHVAALLRSGLVRLYVDGTEEGGRSEEHTSELQSHLKLVCRLLLEKRRHQWRRTGFRRRLSAEDALGARGGLF